jgi:hypothetical protein
MKKNVFTIGNSNKKLGFGKVLTFSLLAIFSCPIAKKFKTACLNYCYAVGMQEFRSSIHLSWKRNLEFVKLALKNNTFVDLMVSHIQKQIDQNKFGIVRNGQKQYLFRWHVSGDIYSIVYLKAMIQIAKLLPYVGFFGYTKQYANPEFLPYLKEFCGLSNVEIMASADSKIPLSLVPGFMRIAFVSTDSRAGGFYCPEILQAMETSLYKKLYRQCGRQTNKDIAVLALLDQHKQRKADCITCGFCCPRVTKQGTWTKSKGNMVLPIH